MQLKKNNNGLEQVNVQIRELEYAVINTATSETIALFANPDDAIQYSNNHENTKTVQLLDSIGYKQY